MRSISTKANLKRAFLFFAAYGLVTYVIRLYMYTFYSADYINYHNDDSRGGMLQYACEGVYQLDPLAAPAHAGPPASDSHSAPLLFIGILSGQKNVLRRLAIRETLFQHPLVLNKLIAVKFFLGCSSPTYTSCADEETVYEDIVFILNHRDAYRQISKKSLAIITYAAKNTEAKFIMKMDDDSFIIPDRLLGSFTCIPKDVSFLWGNIAVNNRPERDSSISWYLTYEEYSWDFFPPFAFGAGYAVDRKIADFILKNENNLPILPLEDVATGLYVEKARSAGLKVVYMHAFGVSNFRSYHCGAIVVTHYVTPEEYRCMWRRYHVEKKKYWCRCSSMISFTERFFWS